MLGSKPAKTFNSVAMRLRFVQILQIRAFPEEALARRVLDARRVDLARIKHSLLSGAKILANNRDHAHVW